MASTAGRVAGRACVRCTAAFRPRAGVSGPWVNTRNLSGGAGPLRNTLGASLTFGRSGSFQVRLWHSSRAILKQALGGGGGGGRVNASGGGGGGGGGSGGGGGIWAGYLKMLEQSPLLTKACTAGILNALGDGIAQKFVEKNDSFDLKRLGIFAFLGTVLIGPALHFWYGFIGRTVTATGTTGTLIRLAMDQLLWAPLFISTFLASLLTLEGKRHTVKSKLQNDLKPTVIANWKLWVPAQFINFSLVPPHLQVAFSNVVAVAWNTYLSWASHHSAATTSPAEGLP